MDPGTGVQQLPCGLVCCWAALALWRVVRRLQLHAKGVPSVASVDVLIFIKKTTKTSENEIYVVKAVFNEKKQITMRFGTT